MSKIHLSVESGKGTVEFIDNLTPSNIIPGIELIKNEERALNGKLHVDITASKRKLQIIFDILDNDSFEKVLDVFNVEDINTIEPEGILVKYYDLRDKTEEEKRFFVDNVSFVPFILGEEINWKDIAIDLVQI